jgi:hypothetical protein
MKTGDTVLVFPHGKQKQRAQGKALFVSRNQRSIIVAFEGKPPFVVTKDGILVHPEHGIVMLASRLMAPDGTLIGPWIETTGGGHYEIESTV